ncbi:MAG: prephenate dehydrogenase/arogenate dehydrogenase family protein, partial [Deltaproteobacteria bacterium]|nr:prephenate dehydrogenase/arogenate dehydrogenase family protein [Deltaproteobacteria bacterium]
METFEIGIIGGTGGIGAWFADFFAGEGYTVHVSGRTTGMGLDEMAQTCRVVIVSVPINATIAVIEAVGPEMKEDALLMDFTSLKAEPVRAMLASSRSEVMGCHPLFGPDVPSIEGLNIALCPARIDKWSG